MAEVLGTFEQAVLLEVLRLRDEAYGRAILKAVQERLERELAAGAVHATLERLEGKGLLSSRLGPGTDIRAGRARRFYRLQPAGVRALNDARRTFNNIWRGVKWPVMARESDENASSNTSAFRCASAALGRSDPACAAQAR